MAVARVFGLGPIVFAGSSSVTDAAVSQHETQMNQTIVKNTTAGTPDPGFVAIAERAPAGMVTAHDMKAILDLISLVDGLRFGSALTYTSLDFFYAKYGTATARLGSTDHFRRRFNNGLAVVEQITAQKGQEASARLRIQPIYTGGTAPFTDAVNIALPGSLGITQKFTLGPLVLGSAVDGLQNWTLDTGIELAALTGGGWNDPEFVGIRRRAPVITFSALDMKLSNDVGSGGSTVSSGVAYLRKLSENGSLVADATEEHIAIGFSGMLTVPNAGAQANQEGLVQGRVDITGTVTLDTTSAIS